MPREIRWLVWVYNAVGTQTQSLDSLQLMTVYLYRYKTNVKNKTNEKEPLGWAMWFSGASAKWKCGGPNQKIIKNFKIATEEHSRHGAKLGCTGSILRKLTLGALISLLMDTDSWKAKGKKGSVNTESAQKLSVTWISEWMMMPMSGRINLGNSY